MYSPDYDLIPKLFVLNGTVKTTGTSADLTAGDFGLYNVESHAVVTTANKASHPQAYIAVGSHQTKDKLGLAGGYKVSDKSPAPGKGIDPKRVTAWYKVAPRASKNQIVRLFWDGVSDSGAQFECNKTYYLRLEAQGEPVLRYINHYLVKEYGVHTGCCDDNCEDPCAKTGVDAAVVLAEYAKQINSDPIFSKFAKAKAVVKVAETTITTTDGSTSATVASGTGIAIGQLVISENVAYGTTVAGVTGTTITLSAAATDSGNTKAVNFVSVVTDSYTTPATSDDKADVLAYLEIEALLDPTVFGDCSFLPGDYVEQSFVEIKGSMVTENGDPCDNTDVDVKFQQIQAPQVAAGQGELVARDFISSQIYKQVYYAADPRERETSANVALSIVDRTASYVRYYLIYSKDIHGNPSNNLSQDQYVLCFAVKSGVDASAFETLMLGWLQAFNPSITLKTSV